MEYIVVDTRFNLVLTDLPRNNSQGALLVVLWGVERYDK